MNPTLKTILQFLVGLLIIAGVLFGVSLLFGQTAQAQDYDVTLSATSENARQYRISAEWLMPKSDGNYYNKRFGTSALENKFQQLVDKHVRNRINNERDNDRRRLMQYLTPEMKSTLEQIEADSAAARAARAQDIGSLFIGKSYSPSFSQIWDAAYEEVAAERPFGRMAPHSEASPRDFSRMRSSLEESLSSSISSSRTESTEGGGGSMADNFPDARESR